MSINRCLLPPSMGVLTNPTRRSPGLALLLPSECPLHRSNGRCIGANLIGSRRRCRAPINQPTLALIPQRRAAHAGSNKRAKPPLSRKERRALERLGPNEEKRQQQQQQRAGRQTYVSFRESLRRDFRNLVPDRSTVAAIGVRLPPFLLLALLLVHSSDLPSDLSYEYGVSPIGINMGLGPSMVPTICPLGDVLLRETVSYRLPRWLELGGGLGLLRRRDLRPGDVVVFVLEGGRGYAAKRIVGTEGMEVDRLGEFANSYGAEIGYGIPPAPPGREGAYGGGPGADDEGRRPRTVTVPPGHLWLEGDCPLLSVDSRHYGPVPVSAVRGRLIRRLWPPRRGAGGMALGSDRPDPPTEEELGDGRYGLRRLRRTDHR